MPIYEYRCLDCDRAFEVLVRTNTVAVCPECGSKALSKLPSAPFFVSRGSTWQPGCGSCEREESCAASALPNRGACLAA